jgi:hypothetical protein
MSTPKKRLTRKEAAEFLTDQGYPTKKSFLDKAAVIGGGPPFAHYGNKSLYLPADLLSWAEGRCKAVA